MKVNTTVTICCTLLMTDYIKHYNARTKSLHGYPDMNFPSFHTSNVFAPSFSDKITFNFNDILAIVEMADNFN